MKLTSFLLLENLAQANVAANNSAVTESAESTWTAWEPCSAQCGGGTRLRIKEPCGDESCLTESESCSEQMCQWSEWSGGACSTTCGAGLATRSRTCPEAAKCIGASEETIACPGTGACTVEKSNTWKEWTQWNECTQSCGIGGRKRRQRECDGDCAAIGGVAVQVWKCREKIPCPKSDAIGKWTAWANWTACDGTCSKATKKRWRNCSHGWGKCSGSNKEEVSCAPSHCHLQAQNQLNNDGWGVWQEWGSWTQCSKTCGAGIIKRSRHCTRGDRRACKTVRGAESMTEQGTRFCRVKECPKVWMNNWRQKTTNAPQQQVNNSPAKPSAKVDGNLLQNGNCEKSAGTWGTTTNWFCNSCQASRWTADKKEGASSIRIASRKASWAGINYNLGKKISNGASYHLKGFIKPLAAGHHKMAITAKIENGGKPQYVQQISKVVPGNQWTEISGVVSVPGGSATLYIEGLEKHDYLIDGFFLVGMGGATAATTTPPPKMNFPKHDDGKQKLKDPGFEISPNWGIGWGCQGCVGVPVTDDVKFGKRAMKITQRKDTWAGPVQSLKYGSHIMKNVVYNAQVWIKSLGNDEKMDTYELTVKIDYRNKKDVWLKFGKLCTTPSEGWGLLSGMVQLKDDPHLINTLEFYVEGPAKSRDYLVDGASLKVQKVPESFYEKSNAAIDKLRKVDLTVVADYGASHSNVTIKVEQQKHDFPFGSAIDAKLLTSNANYRKFFFDNFNYAVFENKMKWRQIEWSRGNRQFNEADQAMKLLEDKNIPVRGHAVFWGVDQFVPKWLKGMSDNEQLATCKAHAEDIVGRYKGRVTHWDVNNEMLHGDYFERTLGNNIRAEMFKWTKEVDPGCQTFVNE